MTALIFLLIKLNTLNSYCWKHAKTHQLAWLKKFEIRNHTSQRRIPQAVAFLVFLGTASSIRESMSASEKSSNKTNSASYILQWNSALLCSNSFSCRDSASEQQQGKFYMTHHQKKLQFHLVTVLYGRKPHLAWSTRGNLLCYDKRSRAQVLPIPRRATMMKNPYVPHGRAP